MLGSMAVLRWGYSAHAEIDLDSVSVYDQTFRLLRARGDRPSPALIIDSAEKATPRTRRSTRPCLRRHDGLQGYSAHAEIDPHPQRTRCTQQGLLRARGDRPVQAGDDPADDGATPRTRRSTPRRSGQVGQRRGYSAHAEIDPCPMRSRRFSLWLLRARGDRPDFAVDGGAVAEATPRTRRSTRYGRAGQCRAGGYSAHAEIDPESRMPVTADFWLLRARGDRPLHVSC